MTETIIGIINEWRDMVCYCESDIHPLNHATVMDFLDRIEAAARREREERHNYEQAECERCVRANTATMRHALERILDIEGYGAPMIEAKCIAQKALEGQQCTPPLAQETPQIEQPGNAAAMRAALRIIWDDARKPCKLDREAVARLCKDALSASPEQPTNAADLDALERACEEVLDGDTLKAVIQAKRRIKEGGVS